MIVTKRVSSTQEFRICDRCKLDPNPAAVQTITIRLVGRSLVDVAGTMRAEICDSCFLIIFQQIGLTVPADTSPAPPLTTTVI
jgi:hypothetical protein